MICLLCKQSIQVAWSFHDYFSFKKMEQKEVCASCMDQFVRIKQPTCKGCGRMDREPNQYCQDCVRWMEKIPQEWIDHTALYSYNDAFADWLYAYKFQGDVRMVSVFQEAIRIEMRQHEAMCVVPVPISKASFEKRGFNQCEFLLEAAGIPFKRLLTNRSEGKKQADKNRFERLQAEQPFEQLDTTLAYEQPILLFDDVYTTGRTLLHAKACLVEAGFSKVSSFSLAR